MCAIVNGGESARESRLARLETHVQWIRRDLDGIARMQEKSCADIACIRQALARVKGGWLALTVATGVLYSIATLLRDWLGQFMK